MLASSVCQDVAPPKHLSSLICNSTLVQILGSAAVADGLGIGSSVDAGPLPQGLSPSLPSDKLVLPQGVNPNTRHGAGRLQSPFEVGQSGMARAVQGGPAAAVASLDLPFNIPYSSSGANEFER